MIQARVRADPQIATREERQHFWTSLMYDEGVEASQRNRASELLGKSQGDFIEQVEVREDVHYHISWDSDEEPASPASPQATSRLRRR